MLFDPCRDRLDQQKLFVDNMVELSKKALFYRVPSVSSILKCNVDESFFYLDTDEYYAYILESLNYIKNYVGLFTYEYDKSIDYDSYENAIQKTKLDLTLYEIHVMFCSLFSKVEIFPEKNVLYISFDDMKITSIFYAHILQVVSDYYGYHFDVEKNFLYELWFEVNKRVSILCISRGPYEIINVTNKIQNLCVNEVETLKNLYDNRVLLCDEKISLFTSSSDKEKVKSLVVDYIDNDDDYVVIPKDKYVERETGSFFCGYYLGGYTYVSRNVEKILADFHKRVYVYDSEAKVQTDVTIDLLYRTLRYKDIYFIHSEFSNRHLSLKDYFKDFKEFPSYVDKNNMKVEYGYILVKTQFKFPCYLVSFNNKINRKFILFLMGCDFNNGMFSTNYPNLELVDFGRIETVYSRYMIKRSIKDLRYVSPIDCHDDNNIICYEDFDDMGF